MSKSELIFWASFLRPFCLLVLLLAIQLLVWLIRRHMREGPLKRLLLRPIGRKHAPPSK
jgi:hypothetical protein